MNFMSVLSRMTERQCQCLMRAHQASWAFRLRAQRRNSPMPISLSSGCLTTRPQAPAATLTPGLAFERPLAWFASTQ